MPRARSSRQPQGHQLQEKKSPGPEQSRICPFPSAPLCWGEAKVPPALQTPRGWDGTVLPRPSSSVHSKRAGACSGHKQSSDPEVQEQRCQDAVAQGRAVFHTQGLFSDGCFMFSLPLPMYTYIYYALASPGWSWNRSVVIVIPLPWKWFFVITLL